MMNAMPESFACPRSLREANEAFAVIMEMGIHEIFKKQAKGRPDAAAVVCDGKIITYSELDLESDRLSARIASNGARQCNYIITCMSRSVEMIVSQLAILKSGCAYVPVDPDVPEIRKRMIVENCGANLELFYEEPTAGGGRREIGVRNLLPNNSGRPLLGPLEAPHLSGLSPAYVMYTSGSTGYAKGVVVPHRAVIRLAVNDSYAQIRPSDKVAHCSNPAFDASTFEVWGALLNGATVSIVQPCQVLDSQSFAALLSDEGITVAFLTTALFRQHVSSYPGMFARLRYLLFGGEVVNPEIINRVLRAGGPQSLVHMYGPTETTTFASFYPITSLVADDVQHVPIGKAISETDIYILDSEMAQIPTGGVGEIYIGGKGVAIGYLNQPDLTAEKFVADRFAALPGGTLYKTGDLARWREDGNIEFIGREDFQIKIRGFRVELEEIEVTLASIAGVRQSAVVFQTDDNDDYKLVAYATVVEGAGLTPSILRARLASKLPEYMVPSAYVILGSIPLSRNGKVDRKSLPPPDHNAVRYREYVPPRGDGERLLGNLWADVLGLDRTGRDDDFFELGGNSMLAMRLAAKLAIKSSIDLPYGAVYQYPVLKTLAEFIETLSKARPVP